MSADPLKTLLLALERALPEGAGRALFLNGENCPGLPEAAVIQQYFKPKAAGAVPEIPDGIFDAVLLPGSKQRRETRYFIGRALEVLAPDGTLVCAAAGDAGGKRLKGDLEEAGLEPEEISKHKSRAVWAKGRGKKAPEWIADGGPQEILGGAFISQPGLFGWDKIDPGSALLAQSVPPGSLSGAAADFGCGYGFLSDQVLKHNGGIDTLYCIDADYRAVSLCRQNFEEKYEARTEFLWRDLTVRPDGLPPLDAVVMNPPFHEGKDVQYEAGTGFIRTAADALKPGGSLWMVANAHLPYERVLKERFTAFEKVTEENGFKVFHARR